MRAVHPGEISTKTLESAPWADNLHSKVAADVAW